MTAHVPTADRTRDLLAVALRLAAAEGWRKLTRESIARSAGVSPALVTLRLGTADAIRRSVMRAAVRDRCVAVVAEGLALRDKQALRADESLRLKCAAWVSAAA